MPALGCQLNDSACHVRRNRLTVALVVRHVALAQPKSLAEVCLRHA
jgi:hypothetical protein